MAKYVEVGGRGCVLEMVSKLSDGRWLDMGIAGCCWTAAPTLTAAPLWIR